MSTIEFNSNLIYLQNPLKLLALSLTHNNEDAKDLLQDTLLRAINNRRKFVRPVNIKAWLFKIMKNIFINNYRRKVRIKNVLDSTKDLYYLNSKQNNSFNNVESEYINHEIEEVVDDLKEVYSIPFKMYNDGYKYEEIAKALNIPIGTVKSRIFFSRKELQKRLKDYK